MVLPGMIEAAANRIAPYIHHTPLLELRPNLTALQIPTSFLSVKTSRKREPLKPAGHIMPFFRWMIKKLPRE
ncbi:MAG: hypothetical protein U5L09_05900 [Bacteroidales bacterium]|nr:hypothetical protein [Bacteroidales bacterium]